jgi:threonyl-tRNA synthetase
VQDNVPEVIDAAHAIRARMKSAGLRAEVSDRPGQRMQMRIRDAEVRKVPYVVVIGRQDVERGDDRVNLRDTRTGEQRQGVPVEELVTFLQAEALKRGPEAAPPLRR